MILIVGLVLAGWLVMSVLVGVAVGRVLASCSRARELLDCYDDEESA